MNNRWQTLRTLPARMWLWTLLAALTIAEPAFAQLPDSSRLASAAHTAAANDAIRKDASGDPILVGLNACTTGKLGQSGQAIKRGILIAMHEINRAGGVLGRQLKLVEKDNRGMPARGVDNLVDLSRMEDLVAVVGGLNTPVALAQLKAIHKERVIYLGPWAAGTPIVDNGHKPNFVFRVSARDEYAGGFLVRKALERGLDKPGLLLWRTGWGRSNHKAMTAAMARYNMEPAGVEWFNTSQRSMADEIDRLVRAGANAIILVANAPEGLTAIRNMAALPDAKRVPIISHWGITGAEIVQKDPQAFKDVDLTFLQTYSFLEPHSPDIARRVATAYCKHFGACGPVTEIFSPVGTAHAYDLIHLLKRAIEAAGSTERGAVRNALERLDRYDGLVRTYNPPFTPTRHDALDESDFRLSRYDEQGAIIPVGKIITQ